MTKPLTTNDDFSAQGISWSTDVNPDQTVKNVMKVSTGELYLYLYDEDASKTPSQSSSDTIMPMLFPALSYKEGKLSFYKDKGMTTALSLKNDGSISCNSISVKGENITPYVMDHYNSLTEFQAFLEYGSWSRVNLHGKLTLKLDDSEIEFTQLYIATYIEYIKSNKSKTYYYLNGIKSEGATYCSETPLESRPECVKLEGIIFAEYFSS